MQSAKLPGKAVLALEILLVSGCQACRNYLMKNLNRREFLSRTGTASALAPLALGALSGPFLRPAAAAPASASEKVRIGLIGSGGMGQGDLEVLSSTRTSIVPSFAMLTTR